MVDSRWSTPVTLTELDVAGESERDPWLSPDLRIIYFSRLSTGTNKDIYMATR